MKLKKNLQIRHYWDCCKRCRLKYLLVVFERRRAVINVLQCCADPCCADLACVDLCWGSSVGLVALSEEDGQRRYNFLTQDDGNAVDETVECWEEILQKIDT